MGGFETQRVSLESRNTQKGLRTKKLWPFEIGGHNQKIWCTEPSRAYSFLSFSGITYIQFVLSYIWVDSILKWIFIVSMNSHNKILIKELCKLQAMKKISDLQHLEMQLQQPLDLVIFVCSLNSIWYQDLYRWISYSKVFPNSHRTPKKNFGRRSYGRPKLEDTTIKSGAPNQQGPTMFFHFRT